MKFFIWEARFPWDSPSFACEEGFMEKMNQNKVFSILIAVTEILYFSLIWYRVPEIYCEVFCIQPIVKENSF